MSQRKHLRIWAYVLTWNNEIMMPYFLRHYTFVDKIIAYDDGSTDRTREIFESNKYGNPTQTREWRSYTHLSGGEFREDVRAELKGTCWHEAKDQKVDWVFLLDPDEFLAADELYNELYWAKDQNFVAKDVTGYEMYSPKFPKPKDDLAKTITKGVRNDLYSKPIIISPQRCQFVNFWVGCHAARFTPPGPHDITYGEMRMVPPYPQYIVQRKYDGNRLTKSSRVKLLHYRFMGPDHIGKLWETYLPRMSGVNKMHNWDNHCYTSKEMQTKIFQTLAAEATEVLI